MRREFVFSLFLFSVITAPGAVLTSVPYFGNQRSSPITAVAVDPAGNVYITGNALGPIPLVNALQTQPGGGNCALPGKTFIQCPTMFVAKFDPTGTKLIYSTYLSSDQVDYAAGIAVDADGNAYVAGTTQTASPTPQQSLGGSAFVKKLNPDGSALLYTRNIGGNSPATGIAVDANGNAVIVGYAGTDFPSVKPLPVQPSVKSLYVTNDGGRTWRALNNGLSATNINSLAVDPTNPATLYAATSGGLYKSINAGAGWTQLLPAAAVANTVVVDPRHPSTVYVTYTASSNMFLARSSDAGATWTTLSTNFPPLSSRTQNDQIGAFAIDPANSSVLWVIVSPNDSPGQASTVIKSTDAGSTWQAVYTFPIDDNQRVTLTGRKLLIDPQNSSRLYACCIHNPYVPGIGGVYRSDDGGQSWIQGSTGPIGPTGILSPWLDPHDSNALYGNWYSGLQRSIDAGMTWNYVSLPPGLVDHGYEPGALAVDGSGTLYLLNDFGFLLKSADRGVSWAMINGPWAQVSGILAIDPTNPSTLYVASGASPYGTPPPHAFAAKLDPSGVVQWATLLGGSGQDQALAVSLDAAGNAYLTGTTNSDDFPLVNPFQAVRVKNTFPTTSAFVSKISSDGSKLLYSSFLNVTGNDSGNAIAVDVAGNAYVTGGSPAGVYPPAAAFVAKVDPSGSKLVYLTQLTGSDGASAIAVDPQGRVIVAGSTQDPAFPLVDPIQPTLSGSGSNFIARLTTSNTLDFSTYLGSIGINSVALAPSGALWIGGGVSSLGRIDFQTPAAQPGVPLVLEVYNGASYVPGDTIAPGEIVTLIGEELAPMAQTADGSRSLPRTMQGVSVMIGGVAAPLFYVSSGQINFQAPVEMALGSAQLVVQRGTQMSAVRTVSVVANAPGLFLVTISAQSAPIVVHAGDYSLVTEQNPAHRGEYLSVFCTGLGATDPPATSGEPASAAASITSGISADFDGGGMTISYAGLAPGWVGLYQINFVVPDNATPGSKVLSFGMSSSSTNQASIWVQ